MLIRLSGYAVMCKWNEYDLYCRMYRMMTIFATVHFLPYKASSWCTYLTRLEPTLDSHCEEVMEVVQGLVVLAIWNKVMRSMDGVDHGVSLTRHSSAFRSGCEAGSQ